MMANKQGIPGLKDNKAFAIEVSPSLAWPPLQVYSGPFVVFFVQFQALMAMKRDMAVILSPQH